MAYSAGFLDKIRGWLDDRTIPPIAAGDRIVELGSQMINAGTAHEPVVKLIRHFKPKFHADELTTRFPISPHFYGYSADIFRLCGLDYLSYDVTEAPYSRVFDLNFQRVPPEDRGRAAIVTNIGTTEHVANQLNAFHTVHDLLKVGGVAIHHVPIAGMLNHCLFTYHPKFFFSLIVNNRYKLRSVEYSGPSLHADLGVGNTVYEGDYLGAGRSIPGSVAWSGTALYTGMILLIVERRFTDEFVPPVDFAQGYFGEATGFDLSAIMGAENLPTSAWAESYRQGRTPSQSAPSPDWANFNSTVWSRTLLPLRKIWRRVGSRCHAKPAPGQK